MCVNHQQLPTCACGKNTFCKNCGMGTGCLPCDCSPKITYDIVDDEFKIIQNAAMTDYLKFEEQD